MRRVLLTGASGFVGSHLLRHLLVNTDYDIVCPVTFRHRGLSDRIRLALDDIPQAAKRVHVVRCDLAAPISSVTDKAFGHIDYVLNVASDSHVDRSIEQPASFISNNVALMCALLDWVRTRPEIEAIVHTSTDEVYGPAHDGYAHREWVDLQKPSNPYSASKAAQENIAFAYWRTYDLPIVLTNTMNIIGETQDTEKFFPKTLRSVMRGESMTIHGSPSHIGSRFYLHARNQADGVLHVLRHVLGNTRVGPESLRYSHGGTTPFRFHIVGEREIDNLSMAELIAYAAGKPLVYQFEDFHATRPGHDLRYALDGAKMASIGWVPPVPLEQSIQATVDWTIKHPEWLFEAGVEVRYDGLR